jgi:hypothetical protein
MHAHAQRLVSVVKMVTMLGRVYYQRAALLCIFLWAKGLTAKDIHKEMFPVFGGKCTVHKVVHMWVEKRGKHFANDKEAETEVQKWLRQQSKDFYAAGFDTLAMQWYKCIMLVEDMSKNERFSQVRISCVSYIITICDLLTDSPSYIVMVIKRKTCDIRTWKNIHFSTYPPPTLIHLYHSITNVSKPTA